MTIFFMSGRDFYTYDGIKVEKLTYDTPSSAPYKSHADVMGEVWDSLESFLVAEDGK